jgi:alpha-tubulin suppressor-like RCC1 family protein
MMPNIRRAFTVGLMTLALGLMALQDPTPVIAFPFSTDLWVWGANGQGELGNQGSGDIGVPIRQALLPSGTLSSRLAAGDGEGFAGAGVHSLAVARNQSLWGWGLNTFGEVGDGNGGTSVFHPVQVCAPGHAAPCTQFLGAITATAAGSFHSLALDTFGNVWAWGNNDFAQVGTRCTLLPVGICSERAFPVPVWNIALFAQLHQTCGLPIVTAIAAGGAHSLALDACGVVWAWGLNSAGQLGINTTDAFVLFATPSVFPAGTTITAIAAGGDHSLALDSQGNLWAWGNNDHGQLGISNQDVASSKVAVKLPFPQNTRFTKIAAGAFHSLAIDSSGSLWAWGANEHGQLGNGINIDSFGPAHVTFPNGTPRIVTIAGGGRHSLAVDANNNLWAWGANGHGQLGNQQAGASSNMPIRSVFPAGTVIVGIAAGTAHSLALESRSFLFGLEAVVVLQLQTLQALLVPQGLTPDPINVATTSTPIDRAGRQLLVTNTLTDPSGNTLVLTVVQQRDDSKSLALQIQSIRYNDGPVITAPPNRIEFHWSTDARGAITKLDQHLKLDKGDSKTEIITHYDNKTNQTKIHLVLPTGPQKLTEPGLVIVQTATVNGDLSFSDGSRIWPSQKRSDRSPDVEENHEHEGTE